MVITIDKTAGFCWGVVRTIEIVEERLSHSNGKNVCVLGQIIHNPAEIHRLEEIGLKSISHCDLSTINTEGNEVIIRAHGEPPSTYKIAAEQGITVIDATCPLVQNLQKSVRKFYDDGWQIVVFGEKNHAEVIGIRGVCKDECIVVRSREEAFKEIDFTRKTVLFSQTTMDKPTFFDIKNILEQEFKNKNRNKELPEFIAKDTICKHVYGRLESLCKFASENDAVLFVAGKNSSNGKSLYNICRSANKLTYFIESVDEVNPEWFNGIEKLGITGATSTPQWYMNSVKNDIEKLLNNK